MSTAYAFVFILLKKLTENIHILCQQYRSIYFSELELLKVMGDADGIRQVAAVCQKLSFALLAMPGVVNMVEYEAFELAVRKYFRGILLLIVSCLTDAHVRLDMGGEIGKMSIQVARVQQCLAAVLFGQHIRKGLAAAVVHVLCGNSAYGDAFILVNTALRHLTELDEAVCILTFLTVHGTVKCLDGLYHSALCAGDKQLALLIKLEVGLDKHGKSAYVIGMNVGIEYRLQPCNILFGTHEQCIYGCTAIEKIHIALLVFVQCGGVEAAIGSIAMACAESCYLHIVIIL